MPQMDLSAAQNLILQVVENPDGLATLAITDRQIAQALATVLVRNALLGANQNPTDG